VVELRADGPAAGRAVFQVTAGGQLVPTEVRLDTVAGEQRLRAAEGALPALRELRAATFALPATGSRELKVWVHQLTEEDESLALPAELQVRRAGNTTQVALADTSGQAIVALDGAPAEARITLVDGRVPAPPGPLA
jgi:hypothetical protein